MNYVHNWTWPPVIVTYGLKNVTAPSGYIVIEK